MTETPDQDLEAKALLKRFGSHTAVDSLSFSVRRGSFFSILGPSGCGKTTLLRMIAGFIEPDSGDIDIGGRSMRGVPPNRRPVNMVFQQLALFPMMSVGENVAYGLARRGVGRAERESKVEAMLERVGLPGAESKRTDELSGGQRQRVAIARALLKDAPILILDEATSSVDNETEAAIQRVARIADGYFPGEGDPVRLGGLIARVRVATEKAGRDPAGIAINAMFGQQMADPIRGAEQLAGLGVDRAMVPAFFFAGPGGRDRLAAFAEQVVKPASRA